MTKNKTLKIWSPRIPYSLDPLDYDALAHHIHFRSVYSSLVSDYKLGEIKGILASKWWSNSEKTIWFFEIRDNVYFSDGQKIEAQDVALSLNRAALLMKKAKSESGLLEYLIGIDSINSADQLINGISYQNNIVKLSFKKPMNDILSKISFGLYAIVSANNYNSKTGEWLNKKALIGSGPYKVENWTDSELFLSLRSDFPKNLLLAKPIEHVVFHHSADAILDSDLIIDFDDSLAIDETYKFYGPVKSAIRYIECEGWKNPSSICYNEKTRKSLRDNLYTYLDSINFKTTKSFFPLAIKGVSEFQVKQNNLLNSELTTNAFSISKVAAAHKSSQNKDLLTAQEAFEAGMNYIATKYNLKLNIVEPVAKLPTTGVVDFRFRMTAILVDSPHHDIEFMLKSDHGIRLPDSTGEIKKYISLDSFSVQTVNEFLWNQAVVWPIGHMALGVWTKNNSINLSSYNLILPPLDLQWIEWE